MLEDGMDRLDVLDQGNISSGVRKLLEAINEEPGLLQSGLLILYQD